MLILVEILYPQGTKEGRGTQSWAGPDHQKPPQASATGKAPKRRQFAGQADEGLADKYGGEFATHDSDMANLAIIVVSLREVSAMWAAAAAHSAAPSLLRCSSLRCCHDLLVGPLARRLPDGQSGSGQRWCR